MNGVTVKKDGRSKSKPYVARWREPGLAEGKNGRQKRFARKGLADDFAEKKREELARRGAGLPAMSPRTTVGEFYAEKFLRLRGPRVTGGTRRGWERRWAPTKKTPEVWHLQEKWALWPLELVTYEAILEWRTEMSEAGASDATTYMAHDLLVSILSFAKTLKVVHTNEALGCRPQYRPKRLTGPWLPDTVERVREAMLRKAAVRHVPGGNNGRGGVAHWSEQRLAPYRYARARDAMLVAILAYAGLRPGEALALTWAQVGEKLWITHTIPGLGDEPDGADVENGRTKTKVERHVFLQPFLRKLLLAWRMEYGRADDSAPVIPYTQGGEHFNYDQWVNWRSTWVLMLKAAGVEYRKPYHLRHSCISMWIAAGWDIASVAKNAGHTIEVCSGTYAHAFEERDPAEPLSLESAFEQARRAASGRTPTVELATARARRGRA